MQLLPIRYGKLPIVQKENRHYTCLNVANQPAFTCLKSNMETSEQCVKSVQIQQWKHQKNV